MSDIKELLRSDSFQASIETRLALPKEEAVKFVKMFESAVRRSPKLLLCSAKSIELAAHKLADLGLSPIDTFNQVYLIPKGNECTIDIGWRGLCVLAHKIGGVKVLSEVVYEGDTFTLEKGDTQKIAHKIDIMADRSESKMMAVYAIASLPDGTKKIEIMNKKQVDGIKAIAFKRNRSDTPAWTDFYTEMARKTVVKRLCKQLNEVDGIARIIDIDQDENYFDGANSDAIDPSKTAAQRLTDRIKCNLQKQPEALAHEEKVTLDEKWQDEEEGEFLPVHELPEEYVFKNQGAAV